MKSYRVKADDGTIIEMTLDEIIEESGQARALIQRRLRMGQRDRRALMCSPEAGRRLNRDRHRDLLAAEREQREQKERAARQRPDGHDPAHRMWYAGRIN